MSVTAASASRALQRTLTVLGLCLFVATLVFVGIHEDSWFDRALLVVLQTIIAVLIVLSTRRLAFACTFTAGLFAALQGASAIKTELMGIPLLAPDLRYFATVDTLRVLANYPLLCALAACAFLAWLILLVVMWRAFPDSAPRLPRRNWLRAIIALACAVVLMLLLVPGGPAQSFYQRDAQRFMFPHANLSTFFMSFGAMHASKPAYDPADAERFDWNAAVEPSLAANHPDIISVLEESTFDPRLLNVCDIPACTVSLFDESDAATVASGILEVHTYGGATWTSEFAYFAGLPHPIFGDAGLYAAYDLAMRAHHTLPRALKVAGYRTVAVYPVPRGFVNAGVAYEHYGFDEFYDGDDLGLRWTSSDAEIFHAVEEVYRRERALDDRPIFLMTATMRQHAPHDTPPEQLPPPFNQRLFPSLDDYTDVALVNYLQRLHESAAAMANFEQFVLAQTRPTLLVQFGDHQPSFEGREYLNAKTLACRHQCGGLSVDLLCRAVEFAACSAQADAARHCISRRPGARSGRCERRCLFPRERSVARAV